MGYGPITKFIVTMPSGATLTSAIDLGKAWDKVSVVIPSMTSSTDIYFQASADLTGTYRRINHAPTSVSSTVGAQFLNSAVTNCVVPLQNVHVRYLKIEHSTAMTAAVAGYDIICS